MDFFLTSQHHSQYINVEDFVCSYHMHHNDISSIQLFVDEIHVDGKAIVPTSLHCTKRGSIYRYDAPGKDGDKVTLIFKLSRWQTHLLHTSQCTDQLVKLLTHINSQVGTDILLRPLELFALELKQTSDDWPIVQYHMFIYESWNSDVFDWMWDHPRQWNTNTFKQFTLFMCQVLLALRKAACIHGDIKLENILIRQADPTIHSSMNTALLHTEYTFILTDIEGLATEVEQARWCAGRGTKTYLHPTYKTRPGPRYIDDAYAVAQCILKLLTQDFSKLPSQDIHQRSIAAHLRLSPEDPFIILLWHQLLPSLQNILHAPSLEELCRFVDQLKVFCTNS